MASRLQGSFWAQGSDSDDAEPSSEEESTESSDGSSSSSESETAARKGASRFLAGSSDSDSDDARRVVKSAKDRRFEELRGTTDEIRNKMAINDWSAIQSLFDKLNKQLEKSQKVADQAVLPRVYIRLLVELEDFLLKTLGNREAKKKMSSTNAKALNTMRQRLKKHNTQFQEQIDAFREHPESSEEESADSDLDEDASDSTDSDESVAGGEGDDGFEKIKSRGEKKRDKLLTMDPKEITYEMVNKKLREISLARGKKGVDRQEQVEMLSYLATVAQGPCLKIEVLLHVVSAIFDLSPSMATHLPVPLWKRCVGVVLDVMGILGQHPSIVVDDAFEGSADRIEEPSKPEEMKVPGSLPAVVERLDDELFKSLQVIDPHTHQYLDRLKDEPVLLALAAKMCEYLRRVGDLTTLARVSLRRLEHFYHKSSAVYNAMKALTIAQQREQADNAEVQALQEEEADNDLDDDPEETKAEIVAAVGTATLQVPADFVMEDSNAELLASLTQLIFEHGDERTKARALLCAIYFKAIHEDFYSARDLLLMSHLQENINVMDISTQILFNRATSQLGLCAFRRGLIVEAHTCLSELAATGRMKELLAQGLSLSRYQDKTPEQEKLERRRQMPFHMHINLELLEAVHLIAALLLEAPLLASPSFDPKKRPLSKPFRRLLDTHERQTFTGPPENVRDHVMAATRALMRGEWKQAYDTLASLPCWALLADTDKVLGMLRSKLQEQGLIVYLLAYGSFYHSLSHKHLTSLFELPSEKVHSIVSKMMMTDQLAGSWDQPSATIVLHSSKPSKVQAAAANLADKAATLLDLNERALALRTGSLREPDDDRDNRGGRDGGFGDSFQRRGRGGRDGGRGGGRDGGFRQPLGGLGRGGRGDSNRLPQRGLRSTGALGGGGRFGGMLSGLSEGRFPDRFSRRGGTGPQQHERMISLNDSGRA